MPAPLHKKLLRRFADVAIGGGLALMLLVIFVGDRLLNSGAKKADNPPPDTSVHTTTKPLRIGVTPPEFDDMGQLLLALGEGYKYTNVTVAELENPAKLADYDIIFFTCGKSTNLPATLKDSLRQFVAKGGTLYASDLRFDVIAEAFPEVVDAETNAQGVKQDVKAEVVDEALHKVLGAAMPLHFDEDGWRPAAFKGSSVRVLLKGTVKTNAGIDIACPLLVQFPYQEGNVVFTSFHNEKQQKGLEEQLLKHLVLTTVTARLQSTVTKTMITGGFSPQSHNLLSASKGSPTVTQTYYNKQAGRLKFVLGFEDQGASLRLEVQGPDGQRFDKEGNSTFTIDVPQAGPGDWKYTITAQKIPYPNYPYTMTVGGESDNKKTPTDVIAQKKDPNKDPTLGTIVFKELPPLTVRGTELRLAVTPTGYDNIGLVLRKLGEGYKFTDIPITHLQDASQMEKFDIVFVNCAGGQATSPKARETLRNFVARGGTIYASDLQYPTIANAFPEFARKNLEDQAPVQTLTANVLDAGLKDAIGAAMNINFNSPGWRPAAFGGFGVSVLVEGRYRANKGDQKLSPLLIKFPYKEGTVIFTSFHNSAQNTDTVIKVLEHLVFTAVTAKVQATVTKTMEANGFFPKQAALFSHSAGNPKITRGYANKKVGPLQFALGLQNQGARMKFTIEAPNGQKYQKETTAALAIEVPDAPIGNWLYTVEALQVPYANFPFTVTVGEQTSNKK